MGVCVHRFVFSTRYFLIRNDRYILIQFFYSKTLKGTVLHTTEVTPFNASFNESTESRSPAKQGEEATNKHLYIVT